MTKRRIYISGPITGDPNARNHFQEAFQECVEMGFDPVNPFDNDLPEGSSWEEYMLVDFGKLFKCQMIYMLNGWQSSPGARMEYAIAAERGLEILFESAVENDKFVGIQNDRFAFNVKAAIKEVIGTSFEDHDDDDKSRITFFARMIFTWQCRNRARMKLTQIKKYIKRDHTTMLKYLKKYNDEIKYNPDFRNWTTKVDLFLSNCAYHTNTNNSKNK